MGGWVDVPPLPMVEKTKILSSFIPSLYPPPKALNKNGLSLLKFSLLNLSGLNLSGSGKTRSLWWHE